MTPQESVEATCVRDDAAKCIVLSETKEGRIVRTRQTGVIGRATKVEPFIGNEQRRGAPNVSRIDRCGRSKGPRHLAESP